jgi:tetratricopeptide (TPR) repeat protein
VNGLAFSPDGQRLAATSGREQSTGEVRVWETLPLTEELWQQREAMGLVRWLSAGPRTRDKVLAWIERDPTISEAVRQQAQGWVEPYWQGRVRQAALRLVERRFAQLLLREDVLASLRADGTTGEPVPPQALALAEQYAERCEHLDRAAWDVVWRDDAGPEAYRTALRRAEAAHRLAPQNAAVLILYGAALYRGEQYARAEEALKQSDAVNVSGPDGAHPVTLAFLAMAQQRQNKRGLAQATLERLRELMKTPRWAQHFPATRLRNEAEALCQQGQNGAD